MTVFKWNLALLISIASILAWGCKSNTLGKYNFNEDRYVGDVSFSTETSIRTKLSEQFVSNGVHSVSEGVLEQKRIIRDHQKIDHGIYRIVVDQDFSEMRREYRSGEKFPFYGQISKTDSPLQGAVLESVYENGKWSPFVLKSNDDSSGIFSLLEIYNFDRRELSISYPNKEISVGYVWSGSNVVEVGSGKKVKWSYTAEFKSLETYEGFLCAKFFVRSVRNEVTSSSGLVLRFTGYVYRSVDLNVDVSLESELEVNYEEKFEKDGESWRMIRKGTGSVVGTASILNVGG